MQTRSMTRRGLSRSSSLESRAPSPLRSVQTHESGPPHEVLAVVKSDRAIVEHVEDVSDDGAAQERHVQAQAQQQILNLMHAVQAESHRNTEARLHQAFVETEARLQSTAQALVEAHAKEQALETRRGLGVAIQHALVEAHTQAHEQALNAANEKLSQFTAEINHKILTQLADAISKVGTEGAAYIEGLTAKSLPAIRNDAQVDIAKAAEHTAAKLLALQHEIAALREVNDDLRQQVTAVQDDLRTKLAESERRCHVEAVSTASAQAERIVSTAERRLLEVIENRLASVERRVDEAVVRAETHCNIIEKRSRDSIERVVNDLRHSAPGETKLNFNALLQEQVDNIVEGLPSSQLMSRLEQMAQSAVDSRLSLLLGPKVEELVGKQLGIHGNTRIRNEVSAAIAEYDQQLMGMKLPSCVRTLLNQVIPGYVDEQVASKLSRTAADDRVTFGPKVEDLVTKQLEVYVNARLRTEVAAAIAEYDQQLMSAKLPSSVRILLNQAVPSAVDEQLASKLMPRVRSSVAQVAPEVVNEHLLTNLPQQIRAATPGHVDTYLALKLQPRLMAMVAGAMHDHVETEILTKLQTKMREIAVGVAKEELEIQLEDKRQVHRDEGVASSPLHVIHQVSYPPPPFCFASHRIGSPLAPSLEGKIPASRQPGLNEDTASQIDTEINKALQKSYPPHQGGNQDQHEIDFSTGSVINPRMLLASRRLASEKEKAKSGSNAKPVEEPKHLSMLRTEEIQRFLRDYKRYCDQGGHETWTTFASDAVLQYLRSVECPDGMPDAQILEYLEQKVNDRQKDVDVLERKFSEVKVDPHAVSSKEKVESILFGVESILVESNPDLSVATLVGIVVSKLPQALQTRIHRRMMFSPPLKSKREFAKMLVDEAANFNWPEALK